MLCRAVGPYIAASINMIKMIARSMIKFLTPCYFGRGEGTIPDHDWEQEPQEGEGHRQHHQGKKEFLYPCVLVADHDWE
jgi:hypothetical protein